MKTFIPNIEHSKKLTFDKWSGKFPEAENYKQIISHNKDFQIVQPTRNVFGEYEPIFICVKKAFTGKTYERIKKTLLSIQETSNMRANCSGRIDKVKLEKDNGWIEGIDYKLRTPNSYFIKNHKTNKWGEIAVGNEMNSVQLGYKRGRFTGKIDLSGWSRNNPDRWEILKEISDVNGQAFKKVFPEKYHTQKMYCEKYIKPNHRVGIYTTYSPNQFNEKATRAMSLHVDRGDTKFGYTSMSVFRVGSYKGAYLTLPRWEIGVDIDDGDVVVYDSSQLHGVSPISGDGTRLSCVAYCDDGVATLGVKGKKEKLIGVNKIPERNLLQFT